MKYAICSDVHMHNWKQHSRITADGQNDRLVDVANALRAAGQAALGTSTKTLYIPGDLIHTRGKVSTEVLNMVLTVFTEMSNQGIQVRGIVGNHDLGSKDADYMHASTNFLNNIPGVFFSCSVEIHSDHKVVMIPWHEKVSDLKGVAASIAELVEDPADYDLMIHAPTNGVIEGIPNNGLDPFNDLPEWKRVFSGHYHNHRKLNNRFYSVGSLTHQKWGDVDTLSGYLLVSDDEVQHVETDAPKFIVLEHKKMHKSWMKQAHFFVGNNFVKIISDGLSPEEMSELRADLIGRCGAREVIFINTPKPQKRRNVQSTAKVNEAIPDTVKGFIDASEIEDKPRVVEECINIIEETSE